MIPASGLKPRSGILLLRKSPGLTSFQALNPVKRALGGAKVGHAGTLDRFAEGLLVVLVGQYTRLVPYIVPGEKLYRGVIRFGSETSTLDPEGECVGEGPVPSRDAIETVLPRFRGRIIQRPPVFSAVHIDGKRAYRRALAGEVVDMPEREVEIRELLLEGFAEGDATVTVRCSAGTYIRSLARDIGLACGTRAHLIGLVRLAIGPFLLGEAVGPEDFDPDVHLRGIGAELAQRIDLPSFFLADGLVPRFMNGMAIGPADFRPLGTQTAMAEGEPSAVFSANDALIGLVELEEGRVRYRAVLGSRA